jgi:hypothetical protein
MEKIGIDVHKVAGQVCVPTEDGEYQEVLLPPTRTGTISTEITGAMGSPVARWTDPGGLLRRWGGGAARSS